MAKNIAFVPPQDQNLIYDNLTVTKNPYVPTYLEWLYINGESISKTYGSYGDNAIYSIYRVPQGYTYYLTGISMTNNTAVASGGEYNSALVAISGTTSTMAGIFYLRNKVKKVVNEVSNIHFVPSFPLKVFSGMYILYQNEGNSGDTHGQATITGFLVKN
jgi:hypothetical protein